jgi:hypothetical protein
MTFPLQYTDIPLLELLRTLRAQTFVTVGLGIVVSRYPLMNDGNTVFK